MKRLKGLQAIEACQENPLLGGVRDGFLREEDEELTQRKSRGDTERH
jgi:hypothetical protein